MKFLSAVRDGAALTAATLTMALLVPITAHATPLVVPDNGSGTADMPPIGAEYRAPSEVMMIIDGLPPGTTIELTPVLGSFSGASEAPGGALGGTVVTFSGALTWNAAGTGSLAGYARSLLLPINGTWLLAPRSLGAPVQSFATDAFQMQGSLLGDPDFASLSWKAGTKLGMPSPGHTTLTGLPGGGFAVDSFFDITYQIDFSGALGGPLDGLAGTTSGTIRMQAGEPIVPEPTSAALVASAALLLGLRRARQLHD